MATVPARAPTPTPTRVDDGVSDTIRRLLEAGDVDEARRLAPGTRWERALALPTARPGRAATPEDAERARASFAWLNDEPRTHAYRGQWVALRGDVVVAAARKRDALLRALNGERDRLGLLLAWIES